jgi:Tfp pilus assembly protein PilX
VVKGKPLRQRRRSRERGTTLFVVVLAVTMLTGIGLYTVHSSALLARAAGNEREASQTAYLAQIGTLAALSQLSTAPAAYVPQALSGADDCRMNLGLDTTTFAPPPCLELSSTNITLVTGHTMFDIGTFGTTNAVSGRFLTEVTDVAPALGPVQGMDAVSRNAFHYYEAKLTTTAQLQPAAATAACVQNVMQVAGQHMTRAHVLIGPVGGI